MFKKKERKIHTFDVETREGEEKMSSLEGI